MSKHSKYKNTGLLFELLVRRVTADTLEGKNSKALYLLRKYYLNTELGKEYKLYEHVVKQEKLSETLANSLLDTTVSSILKIDQRELNKQKYNLVREIKQHYPVEVFFKARVHNYKYYAAINSLVESKKRELPILELQNRKTLLEYMTVGETKSEVADETLKKFESTEKGVRTLTFNILLEKFNEKYKGLNPEQKELLSEYIVSSSDSSTQKRIYNKRLPKIRRDLTKKIHEQKEPTIRIKLEEIKKFLRPLGSKDKISSNHIISLLEYYNLLENLV